MHKKQQEPPSQADLLAVQDYWKEKSEFLKLQSIASEVIEYIFHSQYSTSR